MLNPDGSLDVSFGVDGSVATNIGYGDYVPAGSQDSTSAIDHQGRIMIGVVPYFEADNPLMAARSLVLPNEAKGRQV
ncbi:MAG: hypothetical protein IPM25_12840 [Chloracidobacterium sp.]|nr:hypothetical protein [Chloracidobacterium sp.]